MDNNFELCEPHFYVCILWWSSRAAEYGRLFLDIASLHDVGLRCDFVVCKGYGFWILFPRR